MKTSTNAFDICRAYLTDHRHLLLPDDVKVIEGMLRSRNVPGLATLSSRLYCSEYHTAARWKCLLQFEAFFKKCQDLKVDIDTEAAAMASFDSSEQRCLNTNRTLDEWYLEPEETRAFQSEVEHMKRFIANVLGPFSAFLEELPERIKLTSGATSTRPRSESIPFMKVSKRPVCTHGAYPYLQALSTLWGYGKLVPRLTVWNRVVTVLKNWKTKRTIAAEPEGNLPLQLAANSFVVDRLRMKTRIDLSSQLRNQEMAREGSMTGGFATVDLESASNTLAYNPVCLLLEQDWFQYAASVRSPCYKRDGVIKSYHMFSSMGNGLTFGLETLIFAAACHAVGSSKAIVYGDDIIIETHLVESLRDLLNFLGFIFNSDKSHWDGPYRESCGKHWFSGEDVTPLFLRRQAGCKADLCHIVNTLVRLGQPGSGLWQEAKRITREANLPLVPFNGISTSGVWVDIQTAYDRKLVVYKRKTQSVWVKVYAYKAKLEPVYDMRALFLWHLSKTGVQKTQVQKAYALDLYRVAHKLDAFPADEYADMDTPRTSVPTDATWVRKWVVFIPEDRRYHPPGLWAWGEYVTAS